MRNQEDTNAQKKVNIEEEKQEMAEQLKTQKQQVKKNKEIVNELENLKGSNMKELQ